MLGNFGARGKQEHGRELCADFLWLFARVQFSLAVLPFAVFLFCRPKGPRTLLGGWKGRKFWTTVSPHDTFAAPLAHPQSSKVCNKDIKDKCFGITMDRLYVRRVT